MVVVLRDGRHIIGKLSSYDQYGSIVMEQSRERHFAQVRLLAADCILPQPAPLLGRTLQRTRLPRTLLPTINAGQVL